MTDLAGMNCIFFIVVTAVWRLLFFVGEGVDRWRVSYYKYPKHTCHFFPLQTQIVTNVSSPVALTHKQSLMWHSRRRWYFYWNLVSVWTALQTTALANCTTSSQPVLISRYDMHNTQAWDKFCVCNQLIYSDKTGLIYVREASDPPSGLGTG